MTERNEDPTLAPDMREDERAGLPPIDTEEGWSNIDQGAAQDNDHAATGDDTAPLVADEDEEIGHAPDEDAEHPAEPALVPLSPEKKLTEFVNLTEHELAEKGKALAKNYVEIEALKAKRARISAEIKAKEETIGGLVMAITSGQVEVPVGQGDLFRQPVGREEAAQAFDQMANDAAAASQPELAQEASQAAEEQQRLDDLTTKIQDEQGIDKPGPQFLNDIENHKAKMGKRKGRK